METAENVWKYAVNHIETLKLIDTDKLLTKVAALNKDIASEEFNLEQAARSVMQSIWDLHPLHARLTRQMADFAPTDEAGKALLAAWNILPSRLVETHWELVKKAAKRHHIP
ncbi:MAG: hypothetical protein EOP07_18450, partial [Proteobacteria bacterium]